MLRTFPAALFFLCFAMFWSLMDSGSAQEANLAQTSDKAAWVVTLAAGDSTYQPGLATPAVLRQGDRIVSGTKVATGKNGQVILARGVSTMTLSPGSSMEIPIEGQGTLKTRIIQTLGTLLYKIEKNPKQDFKIETPYLAAVIKGTTFTVNVSSQGGAVHVVEGAVQVASIATGQAALVRPGQTARVPADTGSLDVNGKKSGGGNEGSENGNRNDEGDGEKKGKEENQGKNEGVGENGKKAGKVKGKGPKIEAALGATSVDIGNATNGFAGGPGSENKGARGKGGQKPPGANSVQTVNGDAPGNSGNAPAQGGTPPGQGGTPPGQGGGTPPGQGGTPPGQGGGTPPGQGGTPPGQGGGTPPGQGGGNPNAGGGNPNAGGGNPNAGGGNPNAGG